jgi:hypothetical protein
MSLWLSVKLVHVITGTLWVGAAVLLAAYILPTVRALGPAGGPVMQQLATVRRLPVAMNVVGGLSALTGILLFGYRSPAMSSLYGVALTLGALFGLAAAVWGGFVQSRTAKKLGAAAAQVKGAPTPEQAATLQALQDRLYFGARVGAALLVLATLGMALAHPM